MSPGKCDVLLFRIDAASVERDRRLFLHRDIGSGVRRRRVIVGANRDRDGVIRRVDAVGDGELEGGGRVLQKFRRHERRLRGVRIAEGDRRAGELRPLVRDGLTFRVASGAEQPVGCVLIDGCVLSGVRGRAVVIGANRDGHILRDGVRAVGDGQSEDDIGVGEKIGRGE